MRAFAIEGFSHIAVMAQDLKAFGKIILAKPAIHTLTGNRAPMSEPTAVDMIDSEELILGFAAALAFAAIMFKHKLTQSYQISLYAFRGQFFMVTVPFLVTLTLLFGMFFGIGTGFGKNFFTVLGVVITIALFLTNVFTLNAPRMKSIFAVFATMEMLYRSRQPTFTFGTIFKLWL